MEGQLYSSNSLITFSSQRIPQASERVLSIYSNSNCLLPNTKGPTYSEFFKVMSLIICGSRSLPGVTQPSYSSASETKVFLVFYLVSPSLAMAESELES